MVETHGQASAGEVIADYGVIPIRPGSEPLMPANVQIPLERVRASALGSGWITYASLGLSDELPHFYQMEATWQVPCAPRTRSGQLSYLFPSLQNQGWILQPVLQWGVSPAGGGDHWTVASWYADGPDGYAFILRRSESRRATPLVGSMVAEDTYDPDDPGNTPWTVTGSCAFGGIEHTTLYIQDMLAFTSATVTLEAYGITQCSDYPDTNTRFHHITVETATGTTGLSWRPVDQVTDCGQHTEIDRDSTSKGAVTLSYRPPAQFPPGTEVGVASPSKDKLDIFAVDTGGHVLTAAWEPDIAGWRGWWQISDINAPPGAPVAAVSRSKNKLDSSATESSAERVAHGPEFTEHAPIFMVTPGAPGVSRAPPDVPAPAPAPP